MQRNRKENGQRQAQTEERKTQQEDIVKHITGPKFSNSIVAGKDKVLF